MDKGEYEKQLQAARAVLDGMNMPSPLPSRTVPQETHGLVGREEEHASLPSNEAANKIEPGPGLTIHKEDQIESPLLPAASTSAIVASTNALHSPKESKQRNLGASIKKLEAAAIPAVLEADRSGQLAIDYPYLYASAGDLRVADVESLLSAYKELALKYCVLCKAVEGTGISEKNHRVSSPVVDSKDAGTARFSSTAELESAPESTSHSESMAITGEQFNLMGSKTYSMECMCVVRALMRERFHLQRVQHLGIWEGRSILQITIVGEKWSHSQRRGSTMMKVRWKRNMWLQKTQGTHPMRSSKRAVIHQ
jgi:hypothetical protein